jgi:GTP-binding protein
LINGLAGAKIALVSSTPGKTRHLNFYQGKAYRLVDMPGYGFSARSGDEQSSWQEMIEPFLGARENLQGLMIVMDIRRDWSADEEDLLKWLSPRELPFAVVATKADKMSRSQALNRVRDIKKQSRAEHVMMTSSLQKKGYLEIEEFMFHSWIKPGDPSADEAGDET